MMVNNAGITCDATLRKMTLDEWEIVIDVRLKGTCLGTQAAAVCIKQIPDPNTAVNRPAPHTKCCIDGDDSHNSRMPLLSPHGCRAGLHWKTTSQ